MSQYPPTPPQGPYQQQQGPYQSQGPYQQPPLPPGQSMQQGFGSAPAPPQQPMRPSPPIPREPRRYSYFSAIVL